MRHCLSFSLWQKFRFNNNWYILRYSWQDATLLDSKRTTTCIFGLFLDYFQVGWYLKNPEFPIWLLGSETHLTLLFSTVSIMCFKYKKVNLSIKIVIFGFIYLFHMIRIKPVSMYLKMFNKYFLASPTDFDRVFFASLEIGTK